MSQRVRHLALCFLFLAALGVIFARRCPAEVETNGCNQTIRVGLVRTFRNVQQVTLLASSDYTVTRTDSKEKLTACTNLEPITLMPLQNGISIKLVNGSTVSCGTTVTVSPNDAAGMVSVDSPNRPSKQYRGSIEVNLKSGVLQLVSIVNLEDYLPGVLTGEMPASYPDEAQKAQAVAARTYTLCALHRHSSSGYDLCDDAHCQCYDGVLREKPRSTAAVLATRGEVLTYKGKLASVMYCADCGGITESYADAHDRDIPYLPSVVEPSGIGHQSWERSYKLTDLAAKLTAAGVKEADGLQKITIAKASSSGRVLQFEITGAKGTTTITGLKMRNALGRDGIKSTLLTIDTSVDGIVTFKGKGWGHGIGLCQVGAGALAAPPFNYNYGQILQHYYPGTVLSKLPVAIETTAVPGASPTNTHHSRSRVHKPRIETKANGTIQLRIETPKL